MARSQFAKNEKYLKYLKERYYSTLGINEVNQFYFYWKNYLQEKNSYYQAIDYQWQDRITSQLKLLKLYKIGLKRAIEELRIKHEKSININNISNIFTTSLR